MGRFGYQKQSYGMGQDAHQQGYDMNQESSWQNQNKYHQGHATGMQMMPNNVYPQNQALLHNHHPMGLGGERLPNTYGGGFNGSHGGGGGGGMYNYHDEMENSKYERYHEEVIQAPRTSMQAMGYERGSWGDDYGRNNYRGGGYDDGINRHRNGGQQIGWTAKGV